MKFRPISMPASGWLSFVRTSCKLSLTLDSGRAIRARAFLYNEKFLFLDGLTGNQMTGRMAPVKKIGANKMTTTYRASEETTNLARTIRREGKILERFDKEDDKGFHSGFFIEWSGFEWLVKMLNGEVIWLRKLWKIEA